jgi:hypothetical protein
MKYDYHVVRKSLDRERKRLKSEREQQMKGDRRTQHVIAGLAKRLRKGMGK